MRRGEKERKKESRRRSAVNRRGNRARLDSTRDSVGEGLLRNGVWAV